jgi:hypothetical protein
MNRHGTIPIDSVLRVMRTLIEFPDAKACKHWMATELLAMLEEEGFVCKGLTDAVVRADDEEAVRILEELF